MVLNAHPWDKMLKPRLTSCSFDEGLHAAVLGIGFRPSGHGESRFEA